jgi:hypothetical protein
MTIKHYIIYIYPNIPFERIGGFQNEVQHFVID